MPDLERKKKNKGGLENIYPKKNHRGVGGGKVSQAEKKENYEL